MTIEIRKFRLGDSGPIFSALQFKLTSYDVWQVVDVGNLREQMDAFRSFLLGVDTENSVSVVNERLLDVVEFSSMSNPIKGRTEYGLDVRLPSGYAVRLYATDWLGRYARNDAPSSDLYFRITDEELMGGRYTEVLPEQLKLSDPERYETTVTIDINGALWTLPIEVDISDPTHPKLVPSALSFQRK